MTGAVDISGEAHAYLSRLLTHLHPQCEPLPDLMGLCTQIDNALTEIKTLRAALAEVVRVAVEKEREACAFLAEKSGDGIEDVTTSWEEGFADGAVEIAAAIRVRSEGDTR